MEQLILSANDNYKELKDYLFNNKISNLFIVCSKNIDRFNISKFLKELDNINITYFTNYTPNPTYESVVEGVKSFKNSNSNMIIAIGGGSAIDVAKCIKLYSNMDDNKNYLKQEIKENDIKLMAVPTTAGTGSEATRYSVIYYNGEKQSVTHESSIPSVVLFDASMLEPLPEYQKKATLLDALSHSIESYWSVNSTNKSKEYSKRAIELIKNNMKRYLRDDNRVNENMFLASNLAGKAINITQTTAGHAMCYKLTSLYGIPHGHAAALVNSVLLPFMINNIDKCCDPRGIDYLNNTFKELETIIGTDLEIFFSNLLKDLDLNNVSINEDDIDILTNSVNETRLKNNPVKLTKENIKELYMELYNSLEKRKTNGSKRIH